MLHGGRSVRSGRGKDGDGLVDFVSHRGRVRGKRVSATVSLIDAIECCGNFKAAGAGLQELFLHDC